MFNRTLICDDLTEKDGYRKRIFLAFGKRIKTQLSENHLAFGEIQIRFQIRSISENQRSILYFFSNKMRHYLFFIT